MLPTYEEYLNEQSRFATGDFAYLLKLDGKYYTNNTGDVIYIEQTETKINYPVDRLVIDKIKKRVKNDQTISRATQLELLVKNLKTNKIVRKLDITDKVKSAD